MGQVLLNSSLMCAVHKARLDELDEDRIASEWVKFNPAGAGPPRHPPATGGHKVAPPLYSYDDIVAARRDREAKLCTHFPEYLAEVVSKIGVLILFEMTSQ